MPENDESEFEIVVTPEMIGAGLSALEICGASADDHFLVAAVYTAMERERGLASQRPTNPTPDR